MPATVTGSQPAPSGSRQSLIRRLIDRFSHLVRELGKFGAVGGISFVVDIALFNLARVGFEWGPLTIGFEWGPIPAKIFSTAVAATVAFIGNRFWTWRHRERSGLAREYLLYFCFNAVGLGIGLACLAISHNVLGNIWPNVFKTLLADNIAANLIGTALGTLFRFWSYRRFVFISSKDTSMATTSSD